MTGEGRPGKKAVGPGEQLFQRQEVWGFIAAPSHVDSTDSEQNFSTCLSSFKPHNSPLRRTRMGAGMCSVVGSRGGGELQSWDQDLGPARRGPSG